MVKRILVRLEQLAAVLTLALVTDRNVATRERNNRLLPALNPVLGADDNGHVHFEAGAVKYAVGILVDNDSPVFPVQLDGTLPAYEADRYTAHVENQTVCHNFPLS